LKLLLSILSFFLILSPLTLTAQGTTDDELAAYYLDTGAYEKALMYYEKMYNDNPKASNYEGLLTCYSKLENFKEAEKLVKKQLKRYQSNTYYIDLGSVYEAQGNNSAADKSYRDAITNLPESQGLVIRTANEFIKRNKLDYALDTYLYGKKILKGRYPFSYEIASLYGGMGNTEGMISEYLNLIEFNEAYLQTVQNALARSIDFTGNPEDVDLLRNELLIRIQKDGASTTYSEMLTWLFLQQRDFNSAFIQIRALDRRLNEEGDRVLNLANLCINNDEYAVAEKCFNYLIEKGPVSKFYSYARAGALDARFAQLKNIYPPDTAAMRILQNDYSKTINDLKSSYETVSMLRQKARLEAYYLNELEAANITLNEALYTPGIANQTAAEIKLELSEILIIRDYIWDASLLCSQVDKDFKHDMLGFEAKFLNAKISYYTGDFDWAQAQLDVLKGSTSKLISNDAMELSLLITDNMNLDTIYEPMLLFAKADLLTTQHRYNEATVLLDSIMTTWPGHALADDILLQHAKIAEDKYEFEKAISYYKRVIAEHYFGVSADNALFMIADLYENKLHNEEEAQAYYKQLMVDFPGSLYVVEARKRYRAIRGDAPNQEFRPILPDDVKLN